MQFGSPSAPCAPVADTAVAVWVQPIPSATSTEISERLHESACRKAKTGLRSRAAYPRRSNPEHFSVKSPPSNRRVSGVMPCQPATNYRQATTSSFSATTAKLMQKIHMLTDN
jgi:hypothetical protein